MKAAIRRLPDAELEVMQAVWACEPPADREEIDARLRPVHPMAQTTLLTVLSRLGEKGFLRVEREGRRARYVPLISQREYLAHQSSRFIHQLCGGSLSAFAAALCDSGLSREELAELRALLEEERL